MSNKWKFAFHMVVMLTIGVAIGAMINRALVQRHLRHMVQMRSAGLLGPGDKMLLRSAAPGQQKQIREILDRHRERLDKIQTRFNTEIQDSFLSLKKEIDPILTPEQKSQLERMFPPRPRFRTEGVKEWVLGVDSVPGRARRPHFGATTCGRTNCNSAPIRPKKWKPL